MLDLLVLLDSFHHCVMVTVVMVFVDSVTKTTAKHYAY